MNRTHSTSAQKIAWPSLPFPTADEWFRAHIVIGGLKSGRLRFPK